MSRAARDNKEQAAIYAQIAREESHDRKESTYEVRKAKAMSGKEVAYVTCPLCGRGRPATIHWKGVSIPTRFEFKPDFEVIQKRRGGGRGIGFFRVENGGVKLDELQGYDPELYANLKAEVLRLASAFGGTRNPVGSAGRSRLP